jgi:predicted transcriptional regulator
VSLKLTPSVSFIISDIAKAGRRKEKKIQSLNKIVNCFMKNDCKNEKIGCNQKTAAL